MSVEVAPHTEKAVIIDLDELQVARTHDPITIEFNDIHFGTAGKEILKGVSGHASPGQVVAIMGPSGAGTPQNPSLLSRVFQIFHIH
jgi:ATP-binding cassette subfamily B protein